MKEILEKTKLPGGVRILSEKIDYFRSVCLGIWVKAGARDEDEAYQGISHFIEHLIFKGTPDLTATQISEHFDSLGAEINAFSSKEYTCYYIRVLDEYLERAFEVLADIVQNPAWRELDVDSERQVVLEEISLYEDTPDDKIHDVVIESLWSDHPLGRAVLGTTETVGKIGPVELKGYYSRHYTQSNMVVAAVGNVDHKRVVELTDRYFLAQRGEPVTRERKIPKTERVSVFNYKDTEQAHICLAMPALSAHDERRYELAVLDGIFGSGMSSRLFQRIREQEGLAYSVFSYSSQYEETGMFAIYAGTRIANAQRVLDLCIEELRRIAVDGVSVDELERAKNHLVGQLVLSTESTTGKMSRIGKNELLGVEFLPTEEIMMQVKKVDIDMVNDMAKMIYDPERMVMAVIGPFEQDGLVMNRGD